MPCPGVIADLARKIIGSPGLTGAGAAGPGAAALARC